jgi:hypothetical protein
MKMPFESFGEEIVLPQKILFVDETPKAPT